MLSEHDPKGPSGLAARPCLRYHLKCGRRNDVEVLPGCQTGEATGIVQQLVTRIVVGLDGSLAIDGNAENVLGVKVRARSLALDGDEAIMDIVKDGRWPNLARAVQHRLGE